MSLQAFFPQPGISDSSEPLIPFGQLTLKRGLIVHGRQRQTDRQTDRQTETERQIQTGRDRESGRDRDRLIVHVGERQADTKTETERQRQRQRQTETDGQRQTDRT